MSSTFSVHALLDGIEPRRGGALFDVFNPADGSVVLSVASATVADAQAALDGALAAWAPWRARGAAERSLILMRWHQLVMSRETELATLMTLEQGKPLAEARGEVRYAAGYIRWFAEEARRAYGEIVPSHDIGHRLSVQREPVGVCAAITPWNFPLAMITRKAAAALAAGCTMVVKPSEWTPLSALALTRLAREAGIPADVLQMLPADTPSSVAIGRLLCESPVVRKLSFTGSTEVGRILMRQCAGTLKKLSLELGGNAPFIVFDDADLDAAVAGAVASKFRNAGQTCVCSNRFLVQRRVYDAFLARFTAAVARLRMGNGVEPAVDVGPLVNAAAADRVARLVQGAVAQGARLVHGGGKGPGPCFFEPTILADVPAAAGLLCEEVFGPVAPVQAFDTEADAVRMANDTVYGLAAYFYSEGERRCARVADALEYGMVGVNTGLTSTEVAPFGGIKQSGFGREGGRQGLDDYLTSKYICSAI